MGKLHRTRRSITTVFSSDYPCCVICIQIETLRQLRERGDGREMNWRAGSWFSTFWMSQPILKFSENLYCDPENKTKHSINKTLTPLFLLWLSRICCINHWEIRNYSNSIQSIFILQTMLSWGTGPLEPFLELQLENTGEDPQWKDNQNLSINLGDWDLWSNDVYVSWDTDSKDTLYTIVDKNFKMTITNIWKTTTWARWAERWNISGKIKTRQYR